MAAIKEKERILASFLSCLLKIHILRVCRSMRKNTINSTNKEPEAWALEWLRRMSFMDDMLFKRAFHERPDLAEHLIRGILSKPDLNVVKMNTQASLFALNTKEVILDCLCTDSDGKLYNVEVQNEARMPLGRRARAYGSLIDASIFKKGQEYEELPDRYIIFITREDFLKNGRQVTVLAMRDEEGKSEDESGMYHVYGCINNRDENTEAGRVLSDMSCTRAESMYYDGYRERMEDFKVRKEGVREMTGVMEQIMKEGAKQNQAQVAENMIKDGVLPFEKISLYSGMPVSEIQKIASRLGKN